MTETSSRFGRSLVVFLAIAFVVPWLLALPLWLGEGLQSPLFGLVAITMMFVPTIAAVVVVFFVEKPRRKAAALGLVPIRPVGRFIGYVALGLVLPIVFSVGALVVGSALGVFPADFVEFGAFRQLNEQQLAQFGIDELPMPIEVMVVAQFINVVFAGLVLNLIPALGEEIGWRGWLLPRLLRFGPWGAILISGVIWGLWHAPLVLLGYNYPDAPGWLAVAAMTGMCIIVGGVFGWLRLRGGSVWPAAVGHSTFNAAAGLYLVFLAADGDVDFTQATVLGWTGWIIPAVLLIVVVLAGKFRDYRAPADAADAAPTS